MSRLGMTKVEMVVGGVVVGFLLFCFGSQVLVRLPENRIYEKRGRVQSQFHTAAHMLDLYKVDHGAFPPSRTDPELQIADALPPKFQERLDPDPFSKKGSNQYYRYFTRGGEFALVSPGPDGDEDLRAPIIYAAFENPTDATFTLARYDPTNGTDSDGDLVMISNELTNMKSRP